MTDSSIPKFTDPNGRTIPESGQKRFRGNVFTLRQNNCKVGLDIGPDTPIPLWQGEKMDHGMAIEALLWLESQAGQNIESRD